MQVQQEKVETVIRSLWGVSPLDKRKWHGCAWCGVPMLEGKYCDRQCEAFDEMDKQLDKKIIINQLAK